jgi:hypothetical protein
MHPLRAHLLLIATPAVAASLAILAIAGVNKSLWLIQLVAIALACVIAYSDGLLKRLPRKLSPSIVVMVFTVGCIALPLLSDITGPKRWTSVGPLKLYMAPIVLPAFIAACLVQVRERGRHGILGFAAAIGASLLLAVQPDASQVLALSVGFAVGLLYCREQAFKSIVTLIAMAFIVLWAFSKPDPLQPVSYVEGVFALALNYSLVSGAALIACAITLIAGLFFYAFRGASWFSAIAAYYATLYACSVAGLTPAPLIGYGAAPLLGYGFMIATSSWIAVDASRRG